MDQLRAENAQMAQQLAVLTAQMQQLQAAVAAPPAVPPTPPLRRRSPATLPEKFDGTSAQFPAFLGQCELYIALRPEEFPNDQSRVGFILGLLSGPAARWATPFFDPADPLQHNYAQFIVQLRLMYEDPVKAKTASRKLKSLRQGKGTIQAFIQEFRLLARDSTWNESALMDAFQDGLNDEFQDELIRLDPPNTLDVMVGLCLRIDAKLLQRRAPPTRASRTGGAAGPVLQAPQAVPMEIGAARPRLTAEERERRRRLGLCLYCGEAGHFSAACPRKRRTPAMVSAAEASQSEN